MPEFPGLNRAEPSAILLAHDDFRRLGFESQSWSHLNRYVDRIESLPSEFDGGSADVARSLKLVRTAARAYGSPQQLHQLLAERPGTLQDDEPPPTLYATIAWLADHLARSAGSMVEVLRDLPSLAARPDATRLALRQLGGDAEQARKAIGPLVGNLKTFRAAAVRANDELSAAYAAAAAALRPLQEQVGRLRAQAENLEAEVARQGLFRGGRKSDLVREQGELSEHLRNAEAGAETLRASLSPIEPILEDGFWLAQAVDDLLGFLEKLRQVLTIFGSSMTQLAADGSDDELQDADRLQSLLGDERAAQQWRAVAEAAAGFVARAPSGNAVR